MLATETAHHWLERWDRQQEVYIADREERFAVIADVVEAAVERPDPLIVDLGCGPGSLSARLLDRLPRARIVGVDADPLLLGMARAGYGDRPGLRLVQADLRSAGWIGRLDLDRAPDAVVSTTALHWMSRREFGRLVSDVVALLTPGGVFVNGGHIEEGDLQPRLDNVIRAVREGRARRVQAGGDEDWDAWWKAVEQAPELAELVAARAAAGVEHAKAGQPSYAEHRTLLRGAGFSEVGTVWQCGDERVMVALKEPH